MDKSEYFRDHKLTVLANTKNVQAFRCAKPGTGEYSFQVVIADNMIAMTGDIYEVMVCPGYNRGIGWFRGSVKSKSYFMSKIPRVINLLEYNHKEAIKIVENCGEDESKLQEILKDMEEDECYSPDKFYEAWFDRDLDEPPEIRSVNSQFWFQYAGFLRLAELLDEANFKVEHGR